MKQSLGAKASDFLSSIFHPSPLPPTGGRIKQFVMMLGRENNSEERETDPRKAGGKRGKLNLFR